MKNKSIYTSEEFTAAVEGMELISLSRHESLPILRGVRSLQKNSTATQLLDKVEGLFGMFEKEEEKAEVRTVD